MHHRFEKQLPVNIKKYDAAVNRIREALGSYENIAVKLYGVTGQTVSANAVRRWFNTRSIPIEYAAFFSDLTFESVGVLDFYPWLNKYI